MGEWDESLEGQAQMFAFQNRRQDGRSAMHLRAVIHESFVSGCVGQRHQTAATIARKPSSPIGGLGLSFEVVA